MLCSTPARQAHARWIRKAPWKQIESLRTYSEASTQRKPKEWKASKQYYQRGQHARLVELNKKVDPNDLSATLEAHREQNLSSVIRQIEQRAGESRKILRPSFLVNASDAAVEEPGAGHETTASEELAVEKARNAAEKKQKAADARVFGNEVRKDVERTAREMRPLSTSKEGHATDIDYLSNSKVTRTEEQGYRASRRELLRNYTPKGELGQTRDVQSEALWAAQMDVLRRVRQLIHTNKIAEKAAGEYILEYEGRVVPLKSIQTTWLMDEPWTSEAAQQAPGGMERLDSEIAAFASWMEPTEGEQLARTTLLDLTMDLVRKNAPILACEPFGSQTTGLAMPTSDIDIRLYDPAVADPTSNRSAQQRSELVKALARLRDALNEHPDFTLVVYHGGRFPLVGAQHIPTTLMVQIVAGTEPYQAQASVKALVTEHPNLKALFAVIKTAFDMRSLSDVFNGGLGSYSIFMMIVASLKLHNGINLNSNGPPPTAGSQLIDFCRFYGTQLNTYRFGISAVTGRLFRKKSTAADEDVDAALFDPILDGQNLIQRPVRFQHFCLCLQDPANLTNDLGRQSFAIKHVQETLSYLHSKLLVYLHTSRLKYKTSTLRPLIGRCDLVYDERRAQLELFGDGFLDSNISTAERIEATEGNGLEGQGAGGAAQQRETSETKPVDLCTGQVERPIA